MKAIVVYDSNGNTEKLAQAICSGMKQMGVDTQCKSAGNATPQDMQQAEAWIVGSTNGFLKPSGKLKKLLREGASGSKHKVFLFDARAANSSTGAVDKLRGMVGGNAELAGWTYFSLQGSSLADGEENMAAVYGKNVAQNI